MVSIILKVHNPEVELFLNLYCYTFEHDMEIFAHLPNTNVGDGGNLSGLLSDGDFFEIVGCGNFLAVILD